MEDNASIYKTNIVHEYTTHNKVTTTSWPAHNHNLSITIWLKIERGLKTSVEFNKTKQQLIDCLQDKLICCIEGMYAAIPVKLT